MPVKVKKLGTGRYLITRQDDGAVFNVIFGLKGRWIVESEDLRLDDFATLKQARLAIEKRWTPQTRGMGRANASRAWEIAMGMHGYAGSAAERESR